VEERGGGGGRRWLERPNVAEEIIFSKTFYVLIFFFLLKYVAIACYQLAQPNLIFLLPAGPKRKINFETPRKKT
jgi:hypothetical protein